MPLSLIWDLFLAPLHLKQHKEISFFQQPSAFIVYQQKASCWSLLHQTEECGVKGLPLDTHILPDSLASSLRIWSFLLNSWADRSSLELLPSDAYKPTRTWPERTLKYSLFYFSHRLKNARFIFGIQQGFYLPFHHHIKKQLFKYSCLRRNKIKQNLWSYENEWRQKDIPIKVSVQLSSECLTPPPPKKRIL